MLKRVYNMTYEHLNYFIFSAKFSESFFYVFLLLMNTLSFLLTMLVFTYIRQINLAYLLIGDT